MELQFLLVLSIDLIERAKRAFLSLWHPVPGTC